MLCRPIVCTITGHGCLYQRGLALVFMPTRMRGVTLSLARAQRLAIQHGPGTLGGASKRIARSHAQLSTGSEAVKYSMSRAQGLEEPREVMLLRIQPV